VAVMLRHERDNVYRLDIAGVLRERDFDGVRRAAAAEIRRIGKIRLLVVFARFDGWEAGANWRDLSFYIRHGDDIERIALVADDRWRSETLMFAGADLRKAPVEVFRSADVARARAWLAE
jgi:hypothetical protein